MFLIKYLFEYLDYGYIVGWSLDVARMKYSRWFNQFIEQTVKVKI